MRIYLFCLFLLANFSAFAQDAAKNTPTPTKVFEKKQLTTTRISDKIKIDGTLNEPIWQQASVATDFIQANPTPDAAPSQPTEVRVLYDDNAIYIGATLYDSHPDSIVQEFVKRDNFGNNDMFMLVIDTYRDGQNAIQLLISPNNIQNDCKRTVSQNGENEDCSWDAVWESATTITDKGWVVELAIPYAALRFPKVKDQTWNINFARQIRRKNEWSAWNRLDPKIQGLTQQSGSLQGIKDIKSPIRLSATPFIATSLQNSYDRNRDPKSSWGNSFGGGMDVKYGINDAFTLDMTLVPDFTQVQSDNKILNLSPFEVQFSENRPFFTEGIELFNKGNIFYSRRVGSTPFNYYDVEGQLKNGETIVNNPQKAQLLNAMKISGRTNKGLGIGIFNAIEGETYATIQAEGGKERSFRTAPITNYNMVVLDQNLKNNSYFSVMNTNVLRNGTQYDANVTGTDFQIRDKKNAYAIAGKAAYSQQFYANEVKNGYTTTLALKKISGHWIGTADYNIKSDNFNPNDLGYLSNANERSLNIEMGYNEYEPKGKFNNWWSGLWLYHNALYQPAAFSEISFGGYMGGNTKKFRNFGTSFGISPIATKDYFEPRTSDFSRYLVIPSKFRLNMWFNSDSRKKLQVSAFGNSRFYSGGDGRSNGSISISPRYRISSKLNVSAEINPQWAYRGVGYVSANSEARTSSLLPKNAIVMGLRNVLSFDNSASIGYTFNNKMNLAFRARHYWSRVRYNGFYELTEQNALSPSKYTGLSEKNERLNNTNFNLFNIDMVYTWRFAPGSDVILVWKNGINNQNRLTEDGYFTQFDRLFNAEQSNNFSLKVLYFIDYATLKRVK
jgi:Domain of unknown function (DUF5916)/Carbohydrate family 9 binding domain-like